VVLANFTWDKIGRINTGKTSEVTGVSSPIVIFLLGAAVLKDVKHNFGNVNK
jgi:hypothetical protein